MQVVLQKNNKNAIKDKHATAQSKEVSKLFVQRGKLESKSFLWALNCKTSIFITNQW